MQVVADGAHHHLAGIQADPDLHLDPMRVAELFSVASDGLLHGQGCVTGSYRVVLMRERGAK
jgi:hypothetical protein